jgi:hypothetical protein
MYVTDSSIIIHEAFIVQIVDRFGTLPIATENKRPLQKSN